VVVTAGEEALPYATLDGPLTDEPGPALVTAERHRRRWVGGSADHFTGLGAKQALDAHPARLADLLMDRRRRSLVRPVTALARATGPSAGSFLVPVTVYRAARRLARTPYRTGLETAARHVLDANRAPGDAHGPLAASLSALAWSRPGPAARWLTGEALAEVSARLHRAATLPPAVQRPGEGRARAAR
ncbi:asparagine synthase, partial [Streptomyces hydrogenans]